MISRFVKRFHLRSLVKNSGYFDAHWYLNNNPGVGQQFVARIDPLGHFLALGGEGFSPSADFDAGWYLQNYPDVRDAGINPLVHFLVAGRAEGRWPRQNRALAMDHYLWRGVDDLMLPRLEALLIFEEASPEERGYAAWSLSRWFAFHQDWSRVVELLLPCLHLDSSDPFHPGPFLLLHQALLEVGLHDDAKQVLGRLQQLFPADLNTELAAANQALLTCGDALAWLACVNRIFQAEGLQELRLVDPKSEVADVDFDFLVAAGEPDFSVAGAEVVSVIMPVFNAEATLDTALQSLLAQDWSNLEIILVNDASTDATVELLAAWQSKSLRKGVSLRVLEHTVNSGAYAARNTGMAAATGRFVTVHDCDDWSHPAKLRLQVEALLNDSALEACVSHWARASQSLYFHRWRMEEGIIYRNVSSLMFRRSLLDRLGFWDEVKAGADTEFYYRIIQACGQAAIAEVKPGVPLAFGRSLPDSLTQSSSTHLLTQFVGARRCYEDAFHRWHQRASAEGRLFLEKGAEVRPFPAPAALFLKGEQPDAVWMDEDRVQQSELFDPAWYIRAYPALQTAVLDPVQHYLSQPVDVGLDPGPGFSTSAYAAVYADDLQGMQPFVHFLRYGKESGYEPLPAFVAEVSRKDRPVIALFGHAAGKELFGAERSLVDLARLLTDLGYNLVVVLPVAINREYVTTLAKLSLAVEILPACWWVEGRTTAESTVKACETIFAKHQVAAVYLNTLMQHEPAVAARRYGLPVLVHVREALESDPALCELLGTSAEAMKQRVAKMADVVVVNSDYMFRHWQPFVSGSLFRVYNTVAMEPLLALNVPAPGKYMRVGMLSSNLPKKGIEDFERLAAIMEQHDPSLEFWLYGLHTPYVDQVLERQARGLAPRNLKYGGYVYQPSEAIDKIEVLVSLSSFAESFGRTVLEAMAAARPVIVYDHGALSELVVDGETGFLVEKGDLVEISKKLFLLKNNPSIYKIMADKARVIAKNRFSKDEVLKQMNQVLRKYL